MGPSRLPTQEVSLAETDPVTRKQAGWPRAEGQAGLSITPHPPPRVHVPSRVWTRAVRAQGMQQWSGQRRFWPPPRLHEGRGGGIRADFGHNRI